MKREIFLVILILFSVSLVPVAAEKSLPYIEEITGECPVTLNFEGYHRTIMCLPEVDDPKVNIVLCNYEKCTKWEGCKKKTEYIDVKYSSGDAPTLKELEEKCLEVDERNNRESLYKKCEEIVEDGISRSKSDCFYSTTLIGFHPFWIWYVGKLLIPVALFVLSLIIFKPSFLRGVNYALIFLGTLISLWITNIPKNFESILHGNMWFLLLLPLVPLIITFITNKRWVDVVLIAFNIMLCLILGVLLILPYS